MNRHARRSRIDPRDLPAVRDLVRFGAMTDDQLARRYPDPAFGLSRLPHLKAARLVDLWFESLEGARVYSPTRRAQSIARLHPHTPYASHLSHDIALVDLADYLVAQDPTFQWFAEAEVRGALEQIAPSPRQLEGDTRHRPDGLLVTPEARIAIELEHSDKYQARYASISAWFVREWRIDRVRWYIDNPRILQRLREVNARHGFDRDMPIELEPFPPSVRMRQRQGRYEP